MRAIVAAKSAETNAPFVSPADMGTQLLRAFLFVCAAAATAIAVEPGEGHAWVLIDDKDSTRMSGNMDDAVRARAAAGHGPALWARRDGKEWVIRDAKTLARVRALFAPIDELEHKMQPLSTQQEAWGKQMQQLSRDPERNSSEMSRLGKQMGALGRQMGTLGRQIGDVARAAEEKMLGIVDEARANGLAKEAP
jgi:hypothetical protein